MLNRKRLKQYRQWKALQLFGIAEQPLLPWSYYIHHTEQEIADKEVSVLKKCDNDVNNLL
jgi:hypothetical protein